MKFPMGTLVMTPGAKAILSDMSGCFSAAGMSIVARHHTGDWGDVGKADAKANERALKTGERLLSAYTVDGTKLWIITEADRSVTTILLPDEY